MESKLSSLGSDALAHLTALPKVVIYSGVLPELAALKNATTLQFAIAGASGSGDFCRLDDVLLPMTALRESGLPTDEEVLRRVFDTLR